MKEPIRQIHLDFHTSELLEGIGSRFSRRQFQDALKTGKVELINVFAKCHHSWSYYPTKIGNPHPHLQIDLLGEQIAACHEIGVKAPIYYTMGWSAHDAETHPEWCIRAADGAISSSSPWEWEGDGNGAKPAYQWKHLCPSGSYHEHMIAQVEELCQNYPVDGLWFDIYQSFVPCYCDNCLKGMEEEGLDRYILSDVLKYRALAIKRHCLDMTRLIRSYHEDSSIYFNGLTNLERPENIEYDLYQWNTKNDLEDLPTTWGGYDKFPLRAKFFHKTGKPIVAMSGKFHTSWGEFGGFKDREALKYEAASMIAFGSRVNFGDQLHPLGMMEKATYENIGYAYDYVEKIESLGIGGTPVSRLGLLISNETEADEGITRMLMEEQIDFDVTAAGDDWSSYETVLVPSKAGLLEESADKIKEYLAGGGSLYVLGRGALDREKKISLLPDTAALAGEAEYDQDFTLAGREAEWTGNLPDAPFLNYTAALRFAPTEDTEGLAVLREPYFSRQYKNYCGHMNAPYRLEDAEHPAVMKKGNVIIAAHDLDRIYFAEGARVHRELFTRTLGLIHKRPMARAGLPSAGRISLLAFPHNRYVLHLLYAAPLERGRCLLIEDMPELRDIPVTLDFDKPIKEIRLEPEGTVLKWKEEEGKVKLTLPSFSCHAALEISC